MFDATGGKDYVPSNEPRKQVVQVVIVEGTWKPCDANPTTLLLRLFQDDERGSFEKMQFSILLTITYSTWYKALTLTPVSVVTPIVPGKHVPDLTFVDDYNQ